MGNRSASDGDQHDDPDLSHVQPETGDSEVCDENDESGLPKPQEYDRPYFDASKHRGDLSDGTYVVESALQSGKVMDVSGGSTADYGNVQLYTDNGTDAQVWKVSHDGKGYVTFTNANSGKVLDVNGASTADGANVQQYASNGTWAQKWIAVKNADGSYTFYSGLHDRKVLDVYGGMTSNGANVQLYAGNGTKAQRWTIK